MPSAIPAGWACSQERLQADAASTGMFQAATTAKTARIISGTVITLGRFVGVVIDVAVARIAGKRHVPQAEHVEGRHARPDHRRVEEQPAQAADWPSRTTRPGR